MQRCTRRLVDLLNITTTIWCQPWHENLSKYLFVQTTSSPTIPTAFNLKCEWWQIENILGAWWETESGLICLNWPLWEAFLNVFLQLTPFTHLIHWTRSVYSAHLALFLIQLNDWSCRLQVGLDSTTKKNMACYRGQMTQGTPRRHKLGQKHLCRYPPVS